MFDEQDRQYFYNEFKNNGYEVGSYDDFKKDLNNEEDRNWYYNEAKNMGYDVGTQADFDKMVLEPAPSTSGGGKQVDASSTTQSVEQKASTETKPQVAQPAKKQETTDKDPGLIAKVLDMIPTGVQTSNGTYQPSPEIPQPVVKGEEMPVKEETSSSSSANAASPESKEAAPVTTPTGVVNNEGLMDAKLVNYLENWKQRPDKQSTYFENLVADLLADGTANSNEEAVNMVMPALHRYANRSAMDVTNQVVSSLPDDTVQDAEKSIEAQWYSHAVQDKLKQEAYNMGISYDDYVGLFLKPAMVQSLVNKYGPKYRDIAEGIATRLYSHDENVQDRLMNQDINDALSSVISKYVNPSVVDEYNKAQEAGSKAFTEGMEGSQFIPANLRLGTALGAQYAENEAKDPAKVLSSLQKKFGRLYRNPEFLNDMSNAAFKVMQRYGLNGTQSSDPKQFKPMINSVLKNELDQLEIKGMMPKGSAEYIMKTGLGNTIVGKITRKAVQTDYQNWLEDIANQQYQPGFWENVASGALTFAGDAWSYWLPGAAGGKLTKSMVAKAEGKLAGDLMAKGMERRVAERAAKVLIGKSKAAALKSGAAHGAVTFGGQSAISKPIDEIYRTGQFDENGKIYNPSGWKIALDTLLEGTQQSALGVIMQGNTIANMLGKGRGLATNILADIGGKVADSGIMTGHQILERMAQDPNFKPTGKDAAESFLESMANLTAIGLPGMVGKYARFKDAREFNKKFDFTDQDIAELKRFGYDGLRDAFEKMGIGEYAVVGENAQRFDGQLTQKYMDLMNDKSVPEVLKAKMMAVVEGKHPSSFSPVIDSEVYRGDDGKYYLETYNKDGGVIDRKEYSSHDAARNDEKKLEYEKTLGLASVLEGEFHNEFTQEHLDGLYNKAAQKYNMGEKLTDEDKAAVYLHQNAGAIKEIMDKQQKGIILTDEEQKQVNAYRHYYDSALENSSVMREFVNTFEDSHGVARGTLRKALESKDKKYAPLVESYLKELYNSIELKREMKQIEDDKKRIEQGDVDGAKTATPVEGPASVEGSAGGQEPPVSEKPAPYQDRTNSVPTPSDAEVAANPANSAAEGAGNEPKVANSDAFVMGQNAYKNGDSEALQAIDYNSDLATGRLKRAFADNEKMPDIVANAYSEGKDMDLFVAQRAGSLSPAQKDAISKYVEAMDAKKGAIDALQHADDGYGDALKEQLWPYQTEDGNIVPATLDSGKQVFLKKANEYGGAFVVVPDEQGQPTIKQVSNAEIREVGTPVSLDEYIENAVAQQKDARNKQFISQFDGSGLKPNDHVTVAMEEGDANIDMTFAGYSEDGKIVLTDGKDYLPLSKEEFAAWRKNALDNTINEHLDAEDVEREQKAASQAEADKKQRYANGIVGLSEGQPDYSSNDTDPNVAAEYLQEQFGEDHGKLLNLVNGSRDDIKTQLANKRKAAIEYQNWLDTNADLDPEKAKKVEDELSLVNEQIADLDARFKNWNTIRNSVMTPDEVKAMKEERKAEVEKAGVDESAIVPSDDFHVLVLEDEELKKQYPTMDKATDYITSQRKDLYHTQEDVERKINGVNDMLDQYINGETELDPSQLMELNTTKAQLEALQTNLSVAAKGLKAQANKLSRLYKTEVSKQEMEKLGMTPSEQRKALVADALKKNDMKAIHEIYKDASVDVMDLTPQTLEEAVSESLLPHSLNPESLQYELGKSNFKFGIGKRYDSNKFNYLLAKKGTGLSVNEFAVRVYNDLPINLQELGYSDQDVRNTLLDMFKSYDNVKDMRNVALMNRIAAAEEELSAEEEWYEAQKEREIIERQAEIEEYNSYIQDKTLSLPSESELNAIEGMEYDRMMEAEEREREYKEYVKSILPEIADYDDRSNEEGYGGGGGLGSDSSRRGVDEGNRQGEEISGREAASQSETGESTDSGRKGRQETSSLERGEGSVVRGAHLPQEASFGERLKNAIAETEPNPSEAQKKAGNYKKGHLQFGGYDFTVETPKGTTRSGKDEQGKPWSVTMHDTYGYILGKIGVDGDHIDMFINDAADLDTFDGNVYVVDQVNPETGEFDEHKVMFGYPSEEAATEAYLANYSKGWKGLGKVTSVPKTTFDKWLESSDRKTKPFADYAMIKKGAHQDFISDMEYTYENDVHPSEEDKPKMQKFAERLLNFHQDREDKPEYGYTVLSSNINGDKLYPSEKKWFGTKKYRQGVSWVDKENACAYELNPRFNARGYLTAVGVHKLVPLASFDRDVKEVKPSEMTEAQKVAFDAVSTMLKKAGIPVKVVSNEDMEKVAEAQDNLNLAMLLNHPEMRFKIKTPEEKQAAENAYNFAKELRPNKWAQYAVVDMSNPNKMPEYYQKQELARKERTYLNKLMWGNYKVFNLNKSFEDNVAGLTGSFPSEFDPYKIDEQTNKRNELKKQIKETEDAYNSTGQERNNYQIQLMKEYMDEHGLASENDIPDDVWSKLNDKAHKKYQDKLDSLFAKYKDLDRQLKAIVQPGVRFLRTYHGTGASFDKFDFSHMGEGEGSQAFGWGGYVTNSKDIAEDYTRRAKIRKDNGGFEFVTDMSANNKDMVRQYIYKHKDVNKGLDAMRKDLSSALEMFPDDDDLKELSNILAKKNEEIAVPDNIAYLYDVDIPDDNGDYLDWDAPLTDKQKNTIIKELRRLKIDFADFKKRGFSFDGSFGGNAYDFLMYALRKTKKWKDVDASRAVSKFLSSIGFTGIKYKAGTIFGGAKEGDTNYVIFDENNAKIVDYTKFAQGKGVVYGYTDGKEIVLNQEHLNPNTPIHEYQHLWRTAAKKMNPELIEHGDKLIMQTQLFADLKEDPNYKHLSDDEICDEAFARLTGEDGAAILEQMAKDAIKENPLDTAKELTIINRLKNWLKKFWYWTLDTFTKWKPEDIKKMTLEDIRNLVLRDLAQGVDPRTVLKGQMTKDEAVSLRQQMADNAEPERILEHTEDNWLQDFGKDGRVNTPIGSIKLGENQYKKAGREDRIKRFGLLKPTLERPDVILEKPAPKEGAERQTKYLFVKSFKKVDGTKILNFESITVKQGEDEVSISAHQIEPSKLLKELTESKMLWNRFRGDSNSLGENQGSALTPSANNPSGKDSVLNPHSDAKIRNSFEITKENGGNLSVEDKIKAVSQQFGVDEADVAMYANAIKKGSTAEAARARANIKRHLLQANEDKISSFKELLKYTKPVNEALKENFGDVDAMIEERKQQMEAQRNAMEAARKRAEEEEAKRKKHLEELSLIPDDKLDKQYMEALAKGDDATAREMLDEAARRKGYDDTESAYQGVGAWAAPGNPGYESDKARRDDWESSGSDVNLEDMALGYTPQPDDYFSHPERYSQNTPHGLESVKAINTAIDAIKNGEKDVKVKVYRAVPTSVKEGKLRNGDWVTPSKKYAEMHGTNRLDGKYRIIEDEVPATQLWWDGNDANEFGFDDGKEYKYKNAKNNRKLNDLVTYDDNGDVIPPSKRFNSRKQDVRFHRVTEPEELDRLNKEKTFRMYSGMQEVDGKLYSPMAAIIDGKRTDATEIGAWMGADERPDLVKNGKFQLVKTDKNPGAGEGPVPAAYNPYMHTSTSVMNDQFSGAYARGNIKVVEWEIPESEKTSGYHAVGAKDSVGLVPWTSGTVNSLLPKDRQRSVMLSRWRKAVRIVPDEEVAEKIAAQLSGTGLAIPWNVVTPNQLRELAKLGVPITTVEQGRQNPEVKEKFLKQMADLKKEFPQAQFVDVKMTKDAFKEWGGKGIVKSPIMEQKLKKHPDSLMKAGTYFSGGGLVEEGLKGIIDPVVAVEYDRKISGVYRNNFGQHIVTADVRDVDPKELVKQIDGEVEYFHASPVCKNYSQAKSNGGEVELDKETAKSTADFIDAVKPRVVTIENVKGYKDSEAMNIITKALDKNGYTWDSDVYNAADYGGYTSRERLIVRAVKDGELPEKPKKQPHKGGWLEAVEDILPTLTVKESGVAPWMDARLKVDGIDWQKVEKPLYVMGSAYADGKIPHAYGDEILPTLRTKSGDVIIMPGGKVLRADGRVLARITGLGDDYKLPKTESLAHTIIGNGIPVQLTQGVIAPLLNKDDLSGRNVLARLGSSIFKNNWDADKQKQVSDRVVNTANKLGGAEATVYTSVDEVPDAYLSDVKNGATGWYDPTTHTVHVYLPNCADANEAERTVLHEKIGHEGMEVLLGGEDGVRKFANFVYRSVGKDVRGKIIDFANKYDPDWKNPDRMNVGTQEYIAHLAEEGPKTAEDFSLWTKIKHYLIKLLKKLGVRVPGLLNDKDLRYYLMKAGKALHVWDEMPETQQEAMMKQASNAEIKDALSDGAGKGKPRQKKGESTIQYMKRVQEWRKWQNAREDKENPEPPMFYDIDKDEAGKKEWAQLNKDWRERHHLVGEEPTGMPIRMENEEDDAYMNRIHEYEKWQAAMKDQEDPLPDMFVFEKKKQEVVKRKYEDWLAKHDLLEQQQADLDLYEGKIYPAETNPKADALEQQVMQDLAEVTSTDVSKEGAAMTVKHAVIHRRKNMEEASADDAIYINDVKNRIEKMADSGVFDKLLSDYKGKPNRAEKLAEAIPYIIEAPRRLRDLAHDLNATGAFDKGHIHIQPTDVEAIQPFVADLIAETGKKHTELKDGKEVEVYDDPQAVSDVASKMAQAINANHQGEEGFVPIDGSDILSEHVLPLVKQQIVPEGIDYKNLSPEMKAAIDSIRDWYNYTYDWLKDNHTLREDTGYNADYVNHIWDKEKSDKQAYAMYVENRQRTKSPNEKPRTISTLMEGISVGLVPKTTDITKMMDYYSRSNIEAWANKTMLQELTGLNVIERNEKGKVISTDPLLSSSAPFNLEQYKYFEIPGVGPVWVYNVSPKQVKVKNPITDNEKVLYSEASAGDRFGVVFDTYQSSPFWKTFDTLASSAKKLELGFSGFHAGALTEVYMVQNMVEFGPKKAMANFMKYIFADTAKNHELPCFANPEDFQEAASHLVKFGATNDYAAADVQNMFDNMRDAMIKVQKKLKDGNKISGTVAKASMPLTVATQMLSLINKGMDVALWDFLHDGLKLATYRMRADKTKERAKKKGWTEEELSRALDEDGQFVNDMFGGQHWDVLGASHRTLRYAGRVLLSPDWNASTTRHFLALTGFGSIWNEATFENFKQYYKRLKHKELTPEDEGRRSRQISALLCYGIGFMVFYEGIANGINAAFRALDEEKERKKADEIRKTNPSYKSMYELAYGDEGMKWYDYLMRGNSLGQQSKIFLGRYEDGTEMYVRHGKQFREVPEYLFNHKGELEFPGPMVQRMIGKANPMVRMTLDDINYLSDFQASHADQEIQRKYGKTIGLLYKDALYWAPFLIPSQENKEFKAVDFFFPSSKGFSPWKAQSYFKDFILSGDMEGVVMTYQSCQRNGIDPEAQIKAAIGSVKALESAEMSDGVTSLQEASKRFDAAKSITEKKKMRQKMKKFLSQSDYKAFTQKEALDMVQGYLNGDEDLKEMEKAESKYLMKAKAEDVTEDWRIQNVWNGTIETYQEYQRLKDVDKAKANAFKNSKTNKRLFAARKAISAARRKMNKAKKQMDGTNDAAKLVEIRNTRKELLKTLNGME
jgi:site-specific DNA-cytosine methylase